MNDLTPEQEQANAAIPGFTFNPETGEYTPEPKRATRMIAKTVTIRVPGSFEDDDAQALVDYLDYMDLLDNAISAAVAGVLAAAASDGTPLASIATVSVEE